MAWTPDQPWPALSAQQGVTPGGAARREWSGYVRFWLLAEIAAGNPFHAGAHQYDRLNAGNVLGDASGSMITFGPADELSADPTGLPTTSHLWADLSCDCVSVTRTLGASTAAGVLSNAEASVIDVELFDPTGKYDPLNPSSVYALNGRTRLVPGVRVLAFAEVVTDPVAVPPKVVRYPLFNGTADRWSEAWAREPGDRRGKMQATDFTKNMVKMDRAEQPPVGAGDRVLDRVNRIANYFGFNPPTQWGVPPVDRTLAATTLAQSAWELLNRTMDDELAFMYITPSMPTAGVVGQGIVYSIRESWTDGTAPNLSIGCGGAGFFDIATDAVPTAFDAAMINTVHAARAGGTSQTAANASSVNKWGTLEYNRTDLGLADDAQVAKWANDLVVLSAFPRTALDRLVMEPAVGGGQPPWLAWKEILSRSPYFVTQVTRVVYENDNFDYLVDINVRRIGDTQRITAERWEVEWRTVSADVMAGASVLHAGPHAADRLDAGNVLGV